MMDEELEQLYRARWDVLCTSIPTGESISKPLLASVPTAYEQSKVRVLIVGQETNGWGMWDDWPTSITDRVGWLRSEYRNFDRGRKYNSTFFQAASRLQERVNPDCDAFGFMWLNLFMCDQKNSTPTEPAAETLRSMSMLRDEVGILRPDAVVFFTGPVYDYTIRHERYFPDVAFEPTSKWWAKIHSKYLPQRSVRTYHPSYLRRKKRFDVFDEIADWIRGGRLDPICC
jgi:hypothetical protein